MAFTGQESELFRTGHFPEIVRSYPMMRYMGSKFRLLPWIHSVLDNIEFDSALDGFSGSGCVGYLLKAMGKEVHSSDFLNFPTVLATALIENPGIHLECEDVEMLLSYDPQHRRFIENTFEGIFFTKDDLRFLDRISWNAGKIPCIYKRAIAVAALIQANAPAGTACATAQFCRGGLTGCRAVL